MRTNLQNEMGIKCYNLYSTSEQNGIHIYVEILDRKTRRKLEPENDGKMICTMLKEEAIPMIRCRIKDITHLNIEPCECGRIYPKIGRVTGKADDMPIIEGINVFPSQMEFALMKVPEVRNQCMIYITREGDLDRMQIHVEIKLEMFSNRTDVMQKLRVHIEAKLKRYLNIAVEVDSKAPGELPRFDRKTKRVVDNRVI